MPILTFPICLILIHVCSFKERQVFKTKVIENVQSELNQFGLRM